MRSLTLGVTGNSSVTPASPEEVARIVAEAEKRLRSDAGTDNSAQPSPALPLPGDVNASDSRSVGSLSSLSSLSSSTATDNGVAGADLNAQSVGSAPGNIPEGQLQKELIQIPAQSMTREVEKSSWFQSKDHQGPPSQPTKEKSVLGSDSPSRVNSDSTMEGASLKSSHSGVDLKTMRSGSGSTHSELTMGAGGQSVPSPEISSQGREPVCVPFGTGITSPADLSFKSPIGSTPYASPFPPQAATVTDINPSQHSSWTQAVSSHQPFSSLPQQPPLSHPSSSHPLSPHSISANNADLSAQIPAPSPMFHPNFAPIPQIGPLFPKKAGGFAAEKLVAKSGFVSLELDTARQDGYNELLREKLKLEGQLEILQEEAQSTLQERAELQAQVGCGEGRGLCVCVWGGGCLCVCMCVCVWCIIVNFFDNIPGMVNLIFGSRLMMSSLFIW